MIKSELDISRRLRVKTLRLLPRPQDYGAESEALNVLQDYLKNRS